MLARRLDEEEIELWRHILEAQEGPDSLLAFVPIFSPTYARPQHLRPFAELLHRAEREPVRACVSVPPRHGKTELVLHAVAWWLSRHPADAVGYVSYEAGVARSKSRRARDLALAAGVELRDDAQRVSEWRTPEGGGLLATGIGGPLTGHGVKLLIVDDPLKNREEAESTTIRQRVHEWFTSTALTRLEPGGSAIVVHTRWHDDDLIGRLAKDEDTAWEVVNLPAVDERGAALWPERWSAAILEERRRLVGAYDWASLFLGQPRPKGGRLFGAEPARYDVANVEGARIFIACDPAATASTAADYSSAAVVSAKGVGLEQVVDVLEVFRAQVEIPRLVEELRRLQRRWGAPLGVESVGGFKSIAQMLRALDPSLRVVELQPLGDKFTRALPLAAAWNDGRVRLPREAPWLRDFLSEVQSFTGVRDAHDDQVDALAHAFNAVDRRAAAPVRGARSLPRGSG